MMEWSWLITCCYANDSRWMKVNTEAGGGEETGSENDKGWLLLWMKNALA